MTTDRRGDHEAPSIAGVEACDLMGDRSSRVELQLVTLTTRIRSPTDAATSTYVPVERGELKSRGKTVIHDPLAAGV